jgi:hypothetical protein
MKLFSTLLLALLMSGLLYAQSVTEIIMPQYMQSGGSITSAEDRRGPYVCRLKLNGLQPNKTYRYYTRMVNVGAAGFGGEGAYILVKANGDFIRVTSPSLATAGRYDEFTTDATGSHTGWFISEAASSTTFQQGKELQVRVTINDGNGGIVPKQAFTTTSTVKMLGFNNTSTGGSSIRSTPVTGGTAKNFVFLWDNPAGTSRPVTGCFLEGDGTAGTVANGYASFYENEVNEVDKAWGAIIPNSLANGIQRIGQYRLSDAGEVGYKLSSDGYWPSNTGERVSTVNPTNGLTTTIVLNGAVARLDGANVKSDQVITFNTLPAKTYGDADFDPGATAASGTPVTYTSNNTGILVVVNGQLQVKGAGTATITANHPGDDFYNPAPPVVQTITVNKASLTIKADDQAKVQGQPNPPLTLTYTGFVNGEDAASLNPSPVVSTTATTASPAGTYPITVDGAGSSNYAITYEPGTLTVTSVAQQQTIRFDPLPAKTYGDVSFDPGATATSGLTVSYTSDNPAVATIVNGQIQITGAGTVTITASQAGSDAYEPAADVAQTLLVSPAALTISADDKTRLFNHPNPALTITYTGFVNNETAAVLSSPVIISTTATVSSPVGDYPITVEGATATNYTITFDNGTLSVEPLNTQTITFHDLPVKTYGNAAFAAGAKASSGLAVEYASSDPAVATVTNGIITIHAAGTATITASQPGDMSFAQADPVMRVLTVKKANLSVTAKSLTKKEGEPNPSLTILYNGFVNGDDAGDLTQAPVISTAATTAVVAGVYPITVSGGLSSSNYNIAYFNGTLTVLPVSSDTSGCNAYISTPGRLRINYYAAATEKITIQLFSSYGGRVFDTSLTAVKGVNTWYFEVGNLATGVYPLRISSEGQVRKTKVLIR